MSERYAVLEEQAGARRARDNVLGRKVLLVKCVDRERAKKAAEISHPNLAAIFDLDGDDIVYEDVVGPTLAEKIAEGLSPIDVAKLASALGDALTAAHEAGVAHGAVAPENVRFAKSGLKLLGLGLAAGTADDDQRALAALVYEAFSKKKPSDPPAPLAEMDDARSPLLRARIDAALSRAFDPKKLYPTCRELGASGCFAATVAFFALICGLYHSPIRHRIRIARNAIVENHAIEDWPNGTTIAAASTGPIEVPKLPPSWNTDCAKP